MTKLEIWVTGSILYNGEDLSPDKYRWDEKSRRFSSDVDGLLIDFSRIDDCTFEIENNCILIAGRGNTIRARKKCRFETKDDCRFETEGGCTFRTGSNCKFDTGSDCMFTTGDSCEFDVGGRCYKRVPYSFLKGAYILLDGNKLKI